jgi:hypothetical protein
MPGSTEVRKFITGFLALAILAGGVVFFGAQTPVISELRETPPSRTLSGNAFVEDHSPTENLPVNITEGLARSFADELIAANPLGPKDAKGTLILDAPAIASASIPFVTENEAKIALAIAEVELLKDELDPSKVSVLKNADDEELAVYLQNISEILGTQTFDSGIQKMTEKAATPEAVNSMSVLVSQAVAELDELEVPEQLLQLHLSTRLVLKRLHSVLALPADRSDPMRALLVYEHKTNAVGESITALQREVSELEQELPEISFAPAGWSLIPTAHAQWVVSDIGHTLVNIAKKIETALKWVNKHITEQLKDYLVHKLVQQTVTWIQGGGKPQFVTNWKGFLKGVANEEIGRQIEAHASRLCRSFGPMVRVALLPVELAPEEAVSCTLDQVVANVQDFYNDFSQGGWLAYGAVLEPHNNIFGALIETSGLVSRKAAEEKEAKEKEVETGGGFLSTKQCVQYDRRSEWEKCTAVIRASCAPGIAGTAQCEEIVYNACQAKSRTPGNTCVEYKTTTPGEVIAGATKDSFAAPLLRIVNAQDFAGLINALINSGLTKLVNAGQRGLLGVVPTTDSGSGRKDACGGVDPQFRDRCIEAIRKACEDVPAEAKAECLEGAETPPENGGGEGTPANIERVVPNVAVRSMIMSVIGEGFTTARMFLFAPNGETITLEGGGPYREGTLIHFRIPRDAPYGQYSMRLGETLETANSNLAFFTVVEQAQNETKVVEATPGWNGGVAYSPQSDAWLVVSGAPDRISAALIDNSGEPRTLPFIVNQSDSEVGSPRVVYVEDIQKFLVLWETYQSNSASKIYGRFLDPNGVFLGNAFVVNPSSVGVSYPPATTPAYDVLRSLFVLAWEQRGGGAIASIQLQTLSHEGRPGRLIQVTPLTGARYGYPDIATGKTGEYCMVYTRGEEEGIIVRKVDAETLALGAETVLPVRGFGFPQIEYNSRNGEYLVTYASYDLQEMVGVILSSCDGAVSRKTFSITGGPYSTLAYNPTSNTFGAIGQAAEGLFNNFIALNTDGEVIPGTEKQVFLDAGFGNFSPSIGANSRNGTYGVVSSRDYAIQRFIPDMGFGILRVQ